MALSTTLVFGSGSTGVGAVDPYFAHKDAAS